MERRKHVCLLPKPFFCITILLFPINLGLVPYSASAYAAAISKLTSILFFLGCR
ncbi:hypothetical protein CR513_41251, partial [Mucuna pruriens]